MAKKTFVRRNISASRKEEIAEKCKGPSASTTSAICMADRTFAELVSRRNASKK